MLLNRKTIKHTILPAGDSLILDKGFGVLGRYSHGQSYFLKTVYQVSIKNFVTNQVSSRTLETLEEALWAFEIENF